MLGIAALVAVVVSAILSLVVAPPDAVQGEVQRLMYVHVPAAWLAYLSFFVVFVASVAYLRTRPDPVGPDRRGLGRDRRAVHRAHDRARCPVGQAGLGHVVDLGPAAHHHGDAAAHLPRLPRRAPDRRQPVAARAVGRGDRHRGVRRRADRAPLGHVVALAAPRADVASGSAGPRSTARCWRRCSSASPRSRSSTRT